MLRAPEPWRERLVDAVHQARRSGSLHVLLLLLLVPFLLVGHQLHFWDVPSFGSPRWAVNSDRSFIEILGYVQLAAAALLLLVVGVGRRRGPVYLGWAATLVVVALDDSLRLHERGGGRLVERGLVRGVFGLPEQEFGELAVWALLGLPVLLVLWGTHRRSPAPARRDSWRFAALTVLLMFFAVGVDLLHEVIEEVTDNSVVDLLVTFVEAAGEVGAMTALLAYAVHVVRRRA